LLTESEWLASNDPVAMLKRLNRPLGDRLLLLYGVACCRLHWHLLSHQMSREAVEWTERYVDGLASRDEEYRRIEWYSEGATFGFQGDPKGEYDDDYFADRSKRADIAHFANLLMSFDDQSPVDPTTSRNEWLMALDDETPFDPTFSRYRDVLSVPLIHDIFGNPYRPISFAPHWLTENVIGLARTIYDERCFDRMPILADALMDAGCFDDGILNHCRGKGPHVRGCWVVDLILERN
jgi:hypothetical protein